MKYLDIIQHEFIDKSASILLSAARPKQKVKPKGGYVKRERVGPTDFLQAMGDREVTNPDPKAKKTKVKIKSLKAAPQGSSQNRLYLQLYKQWKGVGAAGVKEITKRDKAITNLKEKLKQQQEKLKAQKLKAQPSDVSVALEKANAALKAEREKFKKFRDEQKPKATEPVVDKQQEVKKDVAQAEKKDTNDQIQQQAETLFDVGDKSNKQYLETMGRISENSNKLFRNANFLNNPPPPSEAKIDVIKNDQNSISKALTQLDLSTGKVADIVNSPNVITYKIKFDDDESRAKAAIKLLSSSSKRIISSLVGKDQDVIVSEDRKNKTFDIQVPKGVELKDRDPVYIKDMLTTSEFIQASKKPDSLPTVFGRDANNKPIIFDFAKTPHLLVSGTTKSGKSVFQQGIVSSIMMSKSPKQAKFVMIDVAKAGAEFGMYRNSEYLDQPVATTVADAKNCFASTQSEMNRRNNFFTEIIQKKAGFSNIKNSEQWNKLLSKKPEELTNEEQDGLSKLSDDERQEMHSIVVMIDEAADLLSGGAKNPDAAKIKDQILNLLRVGRSSGIHVVLATQSPAAETIPSSLQRLLGAKMTFRLENRNDADNLGQPDATSLLMYGDGLFTDPSGANTRLQSAMVSDKETEGLLSQTKGEQQFLPVAEATTDQSKAKQVEEDVKKTLQEAEDRRKQLAQEKTEEKPTTPDEAESYLKKRQEELKRQIREKEDIRKRMLAGQPTMTEDESQPEVYEPQIDSGKELNIPEESSNDDLQKQIDELTKTKEEAEPIVKKEPTKSIEPDRKKSLLDRLKKIFKK